MVTILDADGRPLTDATERSTDRPDLIALDEAQHVGALLHYYFGRGQRRVMVDLGKALLSGRIDTRWEGAGRAWWVTIDAPAAAASLPTGPVDDAAFADSAPRLTGAARTGDAVAVS